MQGVKVEIDPIWLREQYVNKSKTFQDIALELGCGAETVRRYAHKIGIKVRERSEMTLKPRCDKTPISKEWLYDKYVNQNLSTHACADLAGVNQTTIHKRLKEFGINSHSNGYWKRIDIDEVWLRDKYLDEMLSTRKCAELLGVDPMVICDRLNEYGIPIRTRQEAASGELAVWYGKKLSKEHREKIGKSERGERHYNWKGGVSYEPYCKKFNFQLKEKIRDAYDRRCPICGGTEEDRRLSIHHIDYDKMQGCNGRRWNLIPLCTSCHAKTQFDRWYWFNLLYNHWLLNPEINFRMSSVPLFAGK